MKLKLFVIEKEFHGEIIPPSITELLDFNKLLRLLFVGDCFFYYCFDGYWQFRYTFLVKYFVLNNYS